jgi:hypothetical protein
VWLPNKLARAVDLLQAAQGTVASPAVPLLYTSRLQLVDKELQPIGLSRLAMKEPAFANALVENVVTGATLVMNRAARQLVMQGLSGLLREDRPGHLWKHILLHDWWCYLVVSAFGQVVYDSEPGILYRQHGNNQVGQGVGFLARQKKRLQRFLKTGHVRGITQQAELFERLHAHDLLTPWGEGATVQLERFLGRNDSLAKRLGYAVAPDAWRQAWYDNLLLRLLILFNRI